jgi:Fic family protein
MKYQPPYTITPAIVNLVAEIGETIGRYTVLAEQNLTPGLRRENRIRTIQASLAIEGNTLSEAQITAILEGKRVIAPPREVQAVKNALAAYDLFDIWKQSSEKDLLEAHRILMSGLIFEHQAKYYQAIQESTRQTDSAPFIAFMLRMILNTVSTSTQEVTTEVRLRSILTFEMTRQQLKEALGLKDDEHFRKAYLLPALEAGLIEMTIPDKPRSSKQKYRLTDMGRQVMARPSAAVDNLCPSSDMAYDNPSMALLGAIKYKFLKGVL